MESPHSAAAVRSGSRTRTATSSTSSSATKRLPRGSPLLVRRDCEPVCGWGETLAADEAQSSESARNSRSLSARSENGPGPDTWTEPASKQQRLALELG